MARPKEFDQEKALWKAIRTFSRQGFAEPSTEGLMQVMAAPRPATTVEPLKKNRWQCGF
jgi:hypothetical protein